MWRRPGGAPGLRVSDGSRSLARSPRVMAPRGDPAGRGCEQAATTVRSRPTNRRAGAAQHNFARAQGSRLAEPTPPAGGDGAATAPDAGATMRLAPVQFAAAERSVAD